MKFRYRDDLPKDGWDLVLTYDYREGREKDDDDYFSCEYCGCSKVRFVHVIRHPDYISDTGDHEMQVGCECASRLTSNPTVVEDSEKFLKKRANYTFNRFMKRGWKYNNFKRSWSIYQDGEWLTIKYCKDGKYAIFYHDTKTWGLHSLDYAKYKAYRIIKEEKFGDGRLYPNRQI